MSTAAESGAALAARLGSRLELPLRTDNSLAGWIARDTARLYLKAWAMNDDIANAVLQIIAELLGNVVRHTDSKYAFVLMCHLRDRIRIEVSDFGQPRVAGTSPVVHELSDDDEDRRGLALVEFFSVKAGDFPNDCGLTRYSEIALAA
jgi:anti-sigma regulatory factor (Ser/Thr protein kinase)